MAIIQDAPRCPFCNEVTAIAVYIKKMPWEKPIYGESLLKWEPIKHKCKLTRDSNGKN